MDTRLLRVLNNREQNYPRALEYHFPHILEKIMALWDSSECEAYLSELMMTKRTHRQGFPQDVASDIIYLLMLHERRNQTAEARSWAGALRDDRS